MSDMATKRSIFNNSETGSKNYNLYACDVNTIINSVIKLLVILKLSLRSNLFAIHRNGFLTQATSCRKN